MQVCSQGEAGSVFENLQSLKVCIQLGKSANFPWISENQALDSEDSMAEPQAAYLGIQLQNQVVAVFSSPWQRQHEA